KAELLSRNLERCRQDALVDDAYRRGRFRDAVDVRIAGIVGRVVTRAADGDVLLERQAAILLHELEQRNFAQAVEEDRFVVRDYLHVDEISSRIEGNQEVERDAGKAGDRREVGRLEHIADQLIRRRLLLVDGPHRQFAI